MEIHSLQELQTADRMSLAFGPHGLGSSLSPESAAEFQQLRIAECELAAEVADGTRRSFERLKRVFAYGVLCYDVYTLIDDHALLMREQALRDRFVQWCHGSLTFEDAVGSASVTEPVTSYRDVHTLCESLKMRAARARAKGVSQQWKLRVAGELIAFNGTLFGLRTWARCAGLLRGRRSRGIESVQSTLRNDVAHPVGFQGGTPVDAALTLHDLAEFINQLWGRPTPGGRLYPAPVPREIAVIAWNGDGRVQITDARSLREGEDTEGLSHVLARAVFLPGARTEDAHWMEFDARFETTQYPMDYLWGPGTRSAALAWWEREQPQGDTVDPLDRVLLVREHDGQIYPPMRPEVAAGLNSIDQQGSWHSVRADFPIDAYGHVRGLTDREADHARRPGDCRACSVYVLGSGSHRQAVDAAETTLGSIRPVQPPPVRVPHSLHWPNRF
ncbi:hypothetical protein ACH4SK_28225 [Streptomyces inhibens]|uniref:hypothetical protein n=1 Tax=Streptomyces inhibens TaxID=2293571 RepID=UPI00379E450F